MSNGVVTFFKYTKLGFYRRNDDYCESVCMESMLNSLHIWFQERISLEDTLLWDDETPGYGNRKKVYLKSVERNAETGDYILILWRAVGSGDGVYGVKADAKLDDDYLYDANNAADGDRVIWGEASYYWFVPSKKIFASIRFPNSVSDTEMLNLYFKDYIQLHSDLHKSVRETCVGKQGTYTRIYFPSEDGKSNLWLQIKSKQYSKITTESDLDKISQDITHFIQRDVVSARLVQEKDWTRFFRTLPFISQEVTKDTRKIEVSIEARPTKEELKEMLESYAERYELISDNWTNLGFKKEGVGGTCWLNTFIVKNILPIDDVLGGERDDTGHYTTGRIFKALEFKRDGLLAPFYNGDDLEIEAKED